MTYTDREIEQITTLRDAGNPWSAVAQVIGKSDKALRKWWSRYGVVRGLPPKIIHYPKKTDGRIGLRIKAITKDNPKLAIRDYPRALRESGVPDANIPSKSTIGQFLLTNQLRTIKLLKRPLVSERNRERRVEFAHAGLDNLDQLMHETIWSDETTVRRHPRHQELFWRCHSSVERESLPFNEQIQQGGFSVMFWGCFSAYGLGPLVALEGNQNQHTYRDLLRDYLLPEIKAARDEFGVDMIFMQDNAPCHKTKKVMDYLHRNQVRVLDWPPQSPNMNPIENLWHIVKSRRQKKFGFPRTKDELIEQVFEIWESVDQELLDTLSESIESRLREVIRLNGRPTKY